MHTVVKEHGAFPARPHALSDFELQGARYEHLEICYPSESEDGGLKKRSCDPGGDKLKRLYYKNTIFNLVILGPEGDRSWSPYEKIFDVF